MISVLTPSRGRPEMLARMIDSARGCEHLIYLDDDDPSDYEFPPRPGHKSTVWITKGPRKKLGVVFNELAEKATGDYLMLCNDDVIFRSSNWKERLQETIGPEEIAIAGFDDGINGEKHFSFPIVTRAWYEELGYFTSVIFNYGFIDTWIFDIAKRADCAHYIDDVLVEHLHPTVGKREPDKTFKERNWSGDRQRFSASAKQRQRDAQRLINARLHRENHKMQAVPE